MDKLENQIARVKDNGNNSAEIHFRTEVFSEMYSAKVFYRIIFTHVGINIPINQECEIMKMIPF